MNSNGRKSYRPAMKMPVSERAKQFMPFAALKGFEEAIALKEREYFREERSSLSEEKLAELSSAISSLREGDEITVEYYDGYVYTSERSFVLYVDTFYRYIALETRKIYFDDIKNIYRS